MSTDQGRSRRPWLRAWATDSGILLFSHGAVIVATSTLAILVARSLGPAEWGIFSGFLGLSLALSVFAEFGLAAWLLRELSQLPLEDPSRQLETKARAGKLIASGFVLSAAIGAMLIAATGVAAAVLPLDLRLSVAVVAVVSYGALLSASTAMEAFFRSQRRLGRVVAAIFLEKGLLLGLVVVLLAAGFGLVWIALAYAVAGVARLLLNLLNVLLRDEVVLSRPQRRQARELFVRSSPFALNRAFLNVVPRLDVLLLALVSPAAAGYFALGDRILGPALIAPVVMSTALYPFLAREPDARAGRRVVTLLALIGAALAVVGVLAAPFVVPLVFGQEYREAIGVVQVMMLVVPFVFASNPLLVHVYTSRREGRRLTTALALVSLAGTGAVLGGFAVAGAGGAGAGYVLRQAGFVACLLVAGSVMRRPTEAMLDGDAIVDLAGTASRSVA